MTIGDGFKARLEFVLEETFHNSLHGGEHMSRAFVASRLLEAAQNGIVKLEDLRGVAEVALTEASRPPKSKKLKCQLAERSERPCGDADRG
jgi:hypothetical protein